MTNNPETYLAVVEAIQNHIAAMNGEDRYARDWILVCGIENIHRTGDALNEIRMERSPGTTGYSATGLLSVALDCYSADYLDE